LVSKPRHSRPGIGWTGAAGFAVSILLLWWTLHDVELADLARHLRAVRVVPFIACIGVATLAFPIRTIRWQYLLQLNGEKLPFRPLWHATAIGFMANNIVPARAGEFARAFAVGRLTGVSFTAALASLVVERIMDGLTLVAFLALVIFAGGFNIGTTVGGVTFGQAMAVATVPLLVLLGTAVWAVHRPEAALKLGRALVDWILPSKWANKANHALTGVFQGLDVLRDWRRFGVVALWSAVVWGVNGTSFLLCMVAFGLDVPWTAAYLLQSLIAFAVALPSAPGFFGPFEAVTKATLTLYAVPLSLSVSYAFGYHLFTFVPITLLGLYSLSRAQLHLGQLGTDPNQAT
jgi:hypothetical protein